MVSALYDFSHLNALSLQLLGCFHLKFTLSIMVMFAVRCYVYYFFLHEFTTHTNIVCYSRVYGGLVQYPDVQKRKQHFLLDSFRSASLSLWKSILTCSKCSFTFALNTRISSRYLKARGSPSRTLQTCS